MNFFLGTNGPNGFFSYIGDLIDYQTARRVNIIKGLPGGGKSTFIKNMGARLESSPHITGGAEYFYCSSDPDSLDGVLFPKEGIAFIDGTPPHVMEPKCPGAVDSYINLALFDGQAALASKRHTLETLIAANKMGFKLATPLIHSAALMEEAAHKRVASPEVRRKVKARGASLMRREIPKTGRAAAAPFKRFLSAVTPKGLVCRFETVTDNFRRVIALDDNYGLSALILPELAGYAASQGYETYMCYNPLLPETLEHVLIPELSMAFVTNSRKLPYPQKPTRHIRLDSIIPAEDMKSRRAGLRFCVKTRDACLDEAAAHLRDAKLVHDQIENLISPYIDFGAIDKIAASFEFGSET